MKESLSLAFAGEYNKGLVKYDWGNELDRDGAEITKMKVG